MSSPDRPDDVQLRRVHTAINHASFILREAGIVDGRREAAAIACWVLGVDNLVFAPRVFSGSDLDDFFAAIGARSRHIPLQHITGTMHFRYMALESRPDVFVVRPETEYMVQQCIDDFEGAQPCRIVDLCTGSGAIALALATELPHTSCLGVDISPKAVDLAECNAQRMQAPSSNIYDPAHRNHMASGSSTCRFLQGDIRDDRLIDELCAREPWDAVISNPPYVPPGDVTQAEALHDPHIALYGGGLDGMAMPKRVIDASWRLLRAGGRLYMEHAPSQGEGLADYARQAGFDKVSVERDMVGRDRWICAVKGQDDDSC